MYQKKVFHVSVIANLSEREWLALSFVKNLTEPRIRSYVFEIFCDDETDIYLVDGESPEMLQQWRITHAKHKAPTIFLRPDSDLTQDKWQFNKKITPASLLKLVNLLDQVSIQKLHYLPELHIGEEDKAITSALAKTIGSGIPAKSHYKVLVVDDSATVRTQVGIAIKIFGASADFAENMQQALDQLDNASYDIAFLDIVLPDGDGYQICKAIKKSAKHRDTPTIMLTSKSSPIDRVKALLAGCNGFITKPVENAQFQEILSKYLDENTVGETSADA